MKELRNLVRRLLALPDGVVRPANQPAPTGREPFVTVNRTRTTAAGAETRAFDGGIEKEFIHSSYLSTVSINAFGTEAYELLLKLRSVLASSAGIAGMKALGAGVVVAGEVIDLSAIVGAGYEERARVELQISHTHTVVTDQPRIDEVEVDTTTNTGLTRSVDIIPMEST
ncbi:hypothetical protein SAMN02800692_1993 [Luteibacter sp. UNC138MFCol5.1]|uniref:phage neck terminator protein n=1 Tax=Luteibacter sp. UNC138MFCol5.1 TaxID=1502774 RepID=UPI0008C558FB|nr:hypothetical protein [Luteibacter sp. UNC138MFCol5.1]SEO76353.1 hypothetical protein SAMN02800692_1993 [Luteibacter sp. UNC138MFCol5.1]